MSDGGALSSRTISAECCLWLRWSELMSGSLQLMQTLEELTIWAFSSPPFHGALNCCSGMPAG